MFKTGNYFLIEVKYYVDKIAIFGIHNVSIIENFHLLGISPKTMQEWIINKIYALALQVGY